MKIQESRWHTDLVNAILKSIIEIDGKVSNINEALDTGAIIFYETVSHKIYKNICKFINLGFMKVQLFADNGRRWSTDDMLYRKYQRTLDIITHARVDKVCLLY